METERINRRRNIGREIREQKEKERRTPEASHPVTQQVTE